MYATADTGSKFEIAMSETDKKKFFEDVEKDATDTINKMLATVDAIHHIQEGVLPSVRNEHFRPSHRWMIAFF